MKGLQTVLVSLVWCVGVPGCCAYRGINQVSLLHVREVSVADAACPTNGIAEAGTNGFSLLAGRVVVVAENVYVSVGGGTAASNDVAGELSVPVAQ